ncbi:hypothetical protein [Rathayibacter soli]|uniref:hypothetical protein n=1 Tax=Rathayibacter soli TaxID=3144168 RepID=UPI0027E46A96|nr:hypothetical protein [Glaciibacter superstes]
MNDHAVDRRLARIAKCVDDDIVEDRLVIAHHNQLVVTVLNENLSAALNDQETMRA